MPHDPRRIRDAMEGLKFPCNIIDLPVGITTHRADILECSHAVRYSEFMLKDSVHKIRLIFDRLYLAPMKSATEGRVKVEPRSEKTFENSFNV